MEQRLRYPRSCRGCSPASVRSDKTRFAFTRDPVPRLVSGWAALARRVPSTSRHYAKIFTWEIRLLTDKRSRQIPVRRPELVVGRAIFFVFFYTQRGLKHNKRRLFDMEKNRYTTTCSFGTSRRYPLRAVISQHTGCVIAYYETH